MALSGDQLAIGAPNESSCSAQDQSDNECKKAGAVYLFERDEGRWVQRAYLKAPAPKEDGEFGGAVALSGDRLVVGSENADGCGVEGEERRLAGAAYVFERDAQGAWAVTACVEALGGGFGDRFGSEVALFGDLLAVGAPSEDSCAIGVNGDELDGECNVSGAAYLFERGQDGAWSQIAYVKPSTTRTNLNFGMEMALDEGRLAISSPLDNSCSVGIGGDDAPGTCPFAGAVHLYEPGEGGLWMQVAYLKGSNTQGGDRFGSSIAFSKDRLAIGASSEGSCASADAQSNDCEDAGAVYIFERDEERAWSQVGIVKAANAHEGALFGQSLSLSEDRLAVGSPSEEGCASGIGGDDADTGCRGSGAAYLFELREGGDWSQIAYIKPTTARKKGERDSGDFGVVSLSGDQLVVGAPGEKSCTADGGCPRGGVVYSYLFAQ